MNERKLCFALAAAALVTAAFSVNEAVSVEILRSNPRKSNKRRGSGSGIHKDRIDEVLRTGKFSADQKAEGGTAQS